MNITVETPLNIGRWIEGRSSCWIKRRKRITKTSSNSASGDDSVLKEEGLNRRSILTIGRAEMEGSDEVTGVTAYRRGPVREGPLAGQNALHEQEAHNQIIVHAEQPSTSKI